MAKELSQKLLDKLVTIVKKDPNASETFYVEKSGIERGQILRYLVQAEVIANPKLKIPATSKAVVNARDNEALRWPRIAARAGISVSAAQELYEGSGRNAATSYTGRGRKFGEAGGGAGKKASSGRRGGAKTKAAAASSATSGRRGAGKRGVAATKTKTAAAGRKAGRRGTRSSAKAADPK